MDLEDHPAFQAGFGKPLIHPDHRELDDVGRRALDGGVHGVALRQGADGGVLRIDVREEAPASEERLHIPVLPGERDAFVDEGTDGGEGGEVAVDQLLGLFPAQVQPLGEAEGGDAVHDAEVRRLGPAALFARDFLHGDVEDAGGRGGMDIHPVAEGFHQMLVLAEVRHDAE